MNPYTAAIGSAFDLQREALTQSQRMAEIGMETQLRVGRAYAGAMDSQEAAQRRSLELLRSMTHAYVDGMGSMAPRADVTADIDELQSAIDESFDALVESNTEAMEALATSFEEALDEYEAMTTTSQEAVETVTDALVESNEEAKNRTVEIMEAGEG